MGVKGGWRKLPTRSSRHRVCQKVSLTFPLFGVAMMNIGKKADET